MQSFWYNACVESKNTSSVFKKRSVNFRPLFYGCLAFAIGIGFAHYIFSLSLTHIILCCIGFLFCLAFAIFKKNFVNFIVILACFVAGIGAACVDAKNFTHQKFYGQEMVVEGRVGTKIYPQNKTTYLILEDVSYSGESGANLAVNVITAGTGFEFETGMKIKFTAEVYDQFLYENQTFNSFAYKMSAQHSVSINAEDVEVLSSSNFTLAETVRFYVKKLLYQFMPTQTAELSYSILFGDQTQLDNAIKSNFATSGLGHLVAVSGLNTAVLVACLYWLLKAFKTPKLARFIVTAVILIFYCYLCSFASSVVRASIMALVFLGFSLLGRQYDLLSSLGVAGFIILIASPFAVYDAGFLMSFISVAAIGILADPLSKFFTQKCKIPQKLSSALAIDVCTTLAISPILAIYFGKISFFSWLTNLLCVPLFSAAYIIIFLLVIVVSVLPFLGFLFTIPSLIMKGIIWFAGIIAGLKFAIIDLYTLSIIGTAAFFVVLFLFSKLFMASSPNRITYASIAVCAAMVLSSVIYFPPTPTKNTYTQLNTYLASAVLTSKSGEVLVVGGDLDVVEKHLMSRNLRNVNAVVLTESANNISDFIVKYHVKTVISASEDFISVGDFGVQYFYQNQNAKAIFVKLEDFGILIGIERLGTNQAALLGEVISSLKIDAVYETKSSQNFGLVKDFDYVFSRDNIKVQNNYATKTRGAFTFEITNGIIGEIRSEN